ncbi:MAG: hypothetical protein ABSD97_04455 [Acidimicrobiales bacterium]|jgi:hypothetical protein
MRGGAKLGRTRAYEHHGLPAAIELKVLSSGSAKADTLLVRVH